MVNYRHQEAKEINHIPNYTKEIGEYKVVKRKYKTPEIKRNYFLNFQKKIPQLKIFQKYALIVSDL